MQIENSLKGMYKVGNLQKRGKFGKRFDQLAEEKKNNKLKESTLNYVDEYVYICTKDGVDHELKSTIDAAALLGVDRSTIRYMIKNGSTSKHGWRVKRITKKVKRYL